MADKPQSVLLWRETVRETLDFLNTIIGSCLATTDDQNPTLSCIHCGEEQIIEGAEGNTALQIHDSDCIVMYALALRHKIQNESGVAS